MSEKNKKVPKPAKDVEPKPAKAVESQQIVGVVYGRRGQKEEECYDNGNTIQQPNIRENLQNPFYKPELDYSAKLNQLQVPQQQQVLISNAKTSPQFSNQNQFSFQNNQQNVQQIRMNEHISINLIPKKEKLSNCLTRIDNRIQEVKANANQIEKQTRDFCEEIIARLRKFVNEKLWPIQQKKNEILKELSLLDASLKEYSSLTNFNSPQAQILLSNMEMLSQNNFQLSLGMLTDDFPQEVNELKRLKMDNYKLKQLMEFKNEVIWKIFNESQQQQQQLKAELEIQANEEISKWYQLIEQYQIELNKYKLTCCFCGLQFDYQMINTDCNFNQSETEIQLKQQIKEQPPQSYYGNGKHYFSDIRQ